MRRASRLFAVLLLASCGSSTPGDSGSDVGVEINPSAVTGIVDGVDTSSQRIDLTVTFVSNVRLNPSASPAGVWSTGSVYYDSNTRVVYQGNNYNVTDLQRGDEVSVNGFNNNGRYIARTITVTGNVRD